jgi:hypothetical protein
MSVTFFWSVFTDDVTIGAWVGCFDGRPVVGVGRPSLTVSGIPNNVLVGCFDGRSSLTVSGIPNNASIDVWFSPSD